MIDLKKLGEIIDAAIANETPETIAEFLRIDELESIQNKEIITKP